jgi:hypothetical protein
MAAIELELHPKQTLAFESPATEILFGGAAGPGKSHFLRVAAIAWSVQIPGLQTYLFRRQYPDLYSNHMDGPTAFPSMLAPWVESKLVKINYDKNNIVFRNGSVIHLRHCQQPKHVFNYQGAEIHLLLTDELTQWQPGMYRYLRSRLRMVGVEVPDQYRGMFPRAISGANPGGIGHNWVKAMFVDAAPAYAVHRAPSSDGGMMRQYIPARLDDNPTLLEVDPEYKDRLLGLHDQALVQAMLNGDWDIVSGGAIDDVWDRDVHVVQPFSIPSSWYVDRSFDWGSTKPFSVGWWAESDGTPVELADGRRKTYPRGWLFRIGEWYGWNGTPNEGLRLTDQAIGQGIREHEEHLREALGVQRISPGPADSSIFDADPGRDSTAHGINAGYWGNQPLSNRDIFTESDKSPGSRVRRLQALRRRLKAALSDRPEEPGLSVFSTCTDGFIRTVPVLPRDDRNPEDVDTDAEDHCYDEVGYRLTSVRKTARRVKVRLS